MPVWLSVLSSSLGAPVALAIGRRVRACFQTRAGSRLSLLAAESETVREGHADVKLPGAPFKLNIHYIIIHYNPFSIHSQVQQASDEASDENTAQGRE